MSDTAEQHLAELNAVLKSCKGLNNRVEFWAFRGAYNEIGINLAYVKRRQAQGSNKQADAFVSTLQTIYDKYSDIITVSHYYELDGE